MKLNCFAAVSGAFVFFLVVYVRVSVSNTAKGAQPGAICFRCYFCLLCIKKAVFVVAKIVVEENPEVLFGLDCLYPSVQKVVQMLNARTRMYL